MLYELSDALSVSPATMLPSMQHQREKLSFDCVRGMVCGVVGDARVTFSSSSHGYSGQSHGHIDHLSSDWGWKLMQSLGTHRLSRISQPT